MGSCARERSVVCHFLSPVLIDIPWSILGHQGTILLTTNTSCHQLPSVNLPDLPSHCSIRLPPSALARHICQKYWLGNRRMFFYWSHLMTIQSVSCSDHSNSYWKTDSWAWRLHDWGCCWWPVDFWTHLSTSQCRLSALCQARNWISLRLN